MFFGKNCGCCCEKADPAPILVVSEKYCAECLVALMKQGEVGRQLIYDGKKMKQQIGRVGMIAPEILISSLVGSSAEGIEEWFVRVAKERPAEPLRRSQNEIHVRFLGFWLLSLQFFGRPGCRRSRKGGQRPGHLMNNKPAPYL